MVDSSDKEELDEAMECESEKGSELDIDAQDMESEAEIEDMECEAGDGSACDGAGSEKSDDHEDYYPEDYFNSPMACNSGNHREIVEMCIALMEYMAKHEPDILKCLGLQLLSFWWC